MSLFEISGPNALATTTCRFQTIRIAITPSRLGLKMFLQIANPATYTFRTAGAQKMDFPQATLEEIVSSESVMVLSGRARYGRNYNFAREGTLYLTQCIVSLDHDRGDTLARLLALTKKHQILAFLSALRLHRVQARMDLRQVLEAGSAAAYAIANPGIGGFVDIDSFGIMDPSQELAKAPVSLAG